MKILSIRFQNLNSIKGEQTIDFREPPLLNAGLFAITGDTGAGKTTILDALTLGLYGRIHRNKHEEEVMTYGEGECTAAVIFESKKGLFQSQWMLNRANKKATGKLQASKRRISKWEDEKQEWIYLAEKKRDVDEQVELATGLDYNRFCRSVLLSQGDFAAFLKSNEKERSDLLERITGTEIYSQISIAAFERNKLEMEQLQQLQQNLEALDIMDDETEATLQTEQKNKQKETDELKKSVKSIREQFEIVSQLENATQKLIELATQGLTLTERKEAATDDLIKLAAYAKTQPFQALFEAQNKNEKELQELNRTFIAHQKQIPLLENELSTIQTALRSDQIKLKELQSQFNKGKKIWEQVEKLDIEIDKKSEVFALTKSNLYSLKQEDKDLQAQLTLKNERLKNLQQKQKENTDWLKKQRSLKNLKTDFPLLERHRDDLRRLYKEKMEQETQLQQSQQKQERLQQTISKIEQTLERQELIFKEGQQNFQKEIGTSYLADSSQIEQGIQQNIERLQQEVEQLKEMLHLALQYREATHEFNEREDEFNDLLLKETALNKDLLSLMEMVDKLQEKRNYKLHIFEQQQYIANYKKDRAALKEGDPCPLCFSTEHPFRKHPIKPYLNEARTELQQVEEQLAPILKEYKRLQIIQGETIQAIELLKNRKKPQQKMLGVETDITQLGIPIDSDEFAQTTPDILEKKIKEREDQLRFQKAIQQNAQKLAQQLQQQSDQIKASQQKLDIEKIELKNILETAKIHSKKHQQTSKEYEALIKKINKTLKKYNCKFELQTAKATLAQLQKLRDEFETYEKEKEQYAHQLTLLNDQIKTQTLEHKKIQKKQISVQSTFSKEQKEIEQIQAKRQTLFGTDDPKKIKEALQQAIDTTRESVEDQTKKSTQITEQIKGQKNLQKDKERQIATAQKTSETLQEKINKRLQKYQFDSVDAVRQLFLSEEEHQRITQLKENLQKEETLLTQTIANTQQLQSEAKKQRTDQRNISEIKEELHLKEQQLTEIHQHLGRLEERLTESKNKRLKAKKLLQNIKKQKKECARWSRLNEIIGQADGKKFRIFAQGLTLTQLVHLANKHLQSLQERYYILKPEAENLALAIVDTYHANNQRSMNTLSGGESFLVSLALALGLSDLAGQNTRIESLFIDEGFGSLDNNTLDMAISTLENLKSSGKNIGIISHVNSLKERMNTQIKVEKGGNGFSTITIQ